MDDILNHDVSSYILEFIGNEFIFTGTINKKCHGYYKNKPKETNMSSCFETLPKLKDSGLIDDEKQEIPLNYYYNSGSIEVLEYAEEEELVYSINSALEYSIRRKDFKMIDYLESRLELYGPAVMIAAVESGSLDMVKRFCIDNILDHDAYNFFPVGSHVCHLSLGDKLLICRGWKIFVGDYLLESVKEYGHFEIMKWLYNEGINAINRGYDVVGVAAKHGDRKMVQWMLDHGYMMSGGEEAYASLTNDNEYIRWVSSKVYMMSLIL